MAAHGPGSFPFRAFPFGAFPIFGWVLYIPTALGGGLLVVAAEDRVMEVSADNRLIEVADEDRILEVV